MLVEKRSIKYYLPLPVKVARNPATIRPPDSQIGDKLLAVAFWLSFGTLLVKTANAGLASLPFSLVRAGSRSSIAILIVGRHANAGAPLCLREFGRRHFGGDILAAILSSRLPAFSKLFAEARMKHVCAGNGKSRLAHLELRTSSLAFTLIHV